MLTAAGQSPADRDGAREAAPPERVHRWAEILPTLRLWRRRACERAWLLQCDPHIEAELLAQGHNLAREARKPFWRA